jgi:hypothetical protein
MGNAWWANAWSTSKPDALLATANETITRTDLTQFY